MPATYTLISSNVLSSAAASVTFSSIPATYTDLEVRISARGSDASFSIETQMLINSDTSANYSNTRIIGNGATVSSSQASTANLNNFVNLRRTPGSTATSNTFSNTSVYIPNYTSTTTKQISVHDVMENNTTTAFTGVVAQLYLGTSAISNLQILLGTGNLVSGSSFYLYGISNA